MPTATPSPTGSIGDVVWIDQDGDGIQDPTELGLSGIELSLERPDGTIITTTTNASGHYIFDQLPAGTYTVTVNPTTVPDGLIPSYDVDGTPDERTTIVITAGEVDASADFGYQESGFSIGNYVWVDENEDGIQNEPASSGIEGVALTLYKDTDGSGGISALDQVVMTTTTTANGFYAFTNVPAGSYIVVIDSSNYDIGTMGVLMSYGTATYNSADPNIRDDTDSNSIDVLEFGVVTPAFVVDSNNITIDLGILPHPQQTAVSLSRNNVSQFNSHFLIMAIIGLSIATFLALRRKTIRQL